MPALGLEAGLWLAAFLSLALAIALTRRDDDDDHLRPA